MSDARVAKHRANRAVAALSEATSHAPALLPSLSSAAGGLHRPITRVRHFSELEQSRRQRSPLAAQRQVLADMQEAPRPRDDLGALPDTSIATTLAYLGPLSADGAALSATCVQAKHLCLAEQLHEAAVCVVPCMLPSVAALAQRAEVVESLTLYFNTNKRGHAVERFALVDSRFAATAPPAPLPVLRLPLVLRLVAQLTYLQHLDVRGVAWGGPHNAPAVRHFLSDLHLVAPRLQSLKVGAELCRQWAPGWWQRHPDLAHIVVGSRQEEAACSATALATPAPAGSPPPLRLDADFFTMLSCDQRPWRVQLWCRLARESMLCLLGIPAAAAGSATATATPAVAPAVFPTLAELCLNLQDNTEVCSWITESDGAGVGTLGEDTSATSGVAVAAVDGGGPQLSQAPTGPTSPQSQSQARGKTRRGVAAEVAGDTPLFPGLVTLTIANVDARVMSAAEVLGRFFVLAPSLTNFNVCNTTRLPLPEKAKSRKTEKAAPSS